MIGSTPASTLDGATYTYDAVGNRTAKTNKLNGVTSNFTYDALYELTKVTQGRTTTESYTYDAVGNRLSSASVATYTYNSSNELTSTSAGNSYTYDANGNTLSRTPDLHPLFAHLTIRHQTVAWSTAAIRPQRAKK